MKRINFFYITAILTFCALILATNNTNATDIPQKESHITTVIIDPGHGGKDPGAIGGRVKEKNVVLGIALKLGYYIKKNFPEIRVIYTRKTDVFIPLHKRADIANKANADLFISIHANANSNKNVAGTETFVLGQHRSEDNLEVAKKENSVILLEDDYTTTYQGFDPNSSESYIMFELVQDEYKEQSISLANKIQKEFRLRAKRKDRSVKEAGFLVLRRTTMPGILIETGFLSNPAERKYLASNTGKEHIASAIYRAFKIYKTDIEQKSSFHMVAKHSRSKEPQPANQTIQKNRKEKINLFYSVQIMALSRKIETTPANFKGLKNVFCINDTKINRYFSGKYNTLQEAEQQQRKIKKYFSSAFVVGFQNNKLISVKKLLNAQNK